jgi:hypothetical protein
MMRRGIILLIIFILLLLAPSVYRYLTYYGLGGGEERGEIPTYDPAAVVIAESTPPAATFVDEPTAGEGEVLLDMAHENAFTLDELGVLDGRLAARGYELVSYDGGNLAAALRAVNAFVVVTPIREFTFAEIQAVKGFVERGGRLLLVGDPTRFEVVVEEDLFTISFFLEDDQIPLNSLAREFDITFNGDYLYNQVENEGNFRNILLKDSALGESDLTADIEQLAFYGAHSLDVGPGATAVLRGDDNTWSSATDRPGGLNLAASSEDEHVLALSDLHFMTEPYHTSYDNGRFLSHIADFLTTADGRAFTLADFPYFYTEPVNLVYTGQPDLGPLAFDQAIALQDAFSAVDQELDLAATADDHDTLFLGLYNQAGDDVLEILASNDITFTIEPPVLTADEEAEQAEKEENIEAEESEETEDSEAIEDEAAESEEQEPETTRLLHTPLGNVQMSGTALLLLDESGGQRQVIVLAASNEGLDNTVDLLLNVIPLDAEFETAGCVTQDNLALCPTNVADEEVEAELLSGGLPEAEAPEEGEEPEEEPTEEPEEPEPEEPGPEIDATNQGTIGLDETVEGELGVGERHAWTFDSGPAVIDILVQGDENMDTVLELYDSNNNFVTSADSTFGGEDEQILGADIDDDGEWTIVVRDYYDDGGGYTLTVTLSDEQPGEGNSESGAIENIFLFVDDDGEAVGDGFTSADALSTLLSENYDVTLWLSTLDGPLGEDTLANADLLIWDSGDYRDENGFLDEDTAVIFQYLDDGGILFVTGSSPTILADVELAPLSDVEITGDDDILLDGLVSGEVIALGAVYETAVSDLLQIEGDEGSTAFFLRGPESDSAGEILGVATIDSFTEQRSILLLLPFAILPADIQETLLNNIMAWFTEGI